MEYRLRVDESASIEIEVDAGTKKLLCEHRNVEVVGVETAEVTPFKVGLQRLCYLLERRCVLYVIVFYARQLFHFNGNFLFGVHKLVHTFFLTVGEYLYVRNLYHAVFHYVETRCFKVEDHEGLLQVQFHRVVLSRSAALASRA